MKVATLSGMNQVDEKDTSNWKDSSAELNKIRSFLWCEGNRVTKEDPKARLEVLTIENSILSIQKVRCENRLSRDLKVKLIFTYEPSTSVTAGFYSPTDSMIYLYTNQGVSIMDGNSNRIGLPKLSLVERKYKQTFLNMLSDGQLLPSPLAKGMILCITMYEFLLHPFERIETEFWKVDGQNKQRATILNGFIKNHTSNSL